ncbi:alpha-L-rhamnosidase C-terminal domain-containing protein [Streptomyces sp. NPDC088197]|uniref:alpha-L-rhamnosidase-related protein n=1 Tax=Streptomyces sp. NPDC088197 TaxID=3365840 RepID=UPI00382513E5
MTAWVGATAALAEQGGGLWRQDVQVGDWLDPAAPAEDPGPARTDGDLVANAYLVRSADVFARIADILGEERDASGYRRLAARTRAAFAEEFVPPGRRLSCDTQTAYALAIRCVLPPTQRQRLGAVADWLHRTVAGLAAASPGWRHIRVAPVPGAGLTRAPAAHETPYGRAEAGWRTEGGHPHRHGRGPAEHPRRGAPPRRPGALRRGLGTPCVLAPVLPRAPAMTASGSRSSLTDHWRRFGRRTCWR